MRDHLFAYVAVRLPASPANAPEPKTVSLEYPFIHTSQRTSP